MDVSFLHDQMDRLTIQENDRPNVHPTISHFDVASIGETSIRLSV